jgi:Na+-driven multidrug efflux pump
MQKKPSSSASANEEMLRSGSFWQLARKLCLPAILIMLVMVLYHMADVFFIGQTGDAGKVAAVTLASPMFSILSGLGVLDIGRVCLLASIVIGPFLGFYQISTTYLQASGKSRQAIIVSLLEKGIVYIPVLFLMSWLFNMYGIIFASTVTTVLSAVAALTFCYGDYRKELKNARAW